MAYEEVSTELEPALKWEKGTVAEGVYKEVKEDVGPNKSKIYTIGENNYWGAGALDVAMAKVEVGKKVRITCTDDAKQFEKGVGKDFKVEIDQ